MARVLIEGDGDFSRARSKFKQSDAKKSAKGRRRGPLPPLVRLAKRVTVDASTSCHICSGDNSKNGYASIRVRREDGSYVNKRACRLVLEEKLGRELRADEVVRHGASCPRSCINPAHLAAGSHRDNMNDATAVGTLRGRKLNATIAKAIADVLLATVERGSTLVHVVDELARFYKVKQHAIYCIWRGRSYDKATNITARREKIGKNRGVRGRPTTNTRQVAPPTSAALQI